MEALASFECDADLRAWLLRLHEDMVRLADTHGPPGLIAARRPSAANLLHYLAMRRADLRALYRPLKSRGLSTLGRAERHALDNVRSVLARLGMQTLKGLPGPTLDEGTTLLNEHTGALFGPAPSQRDVRIMVTMPSEGAASPALVQSLLSAGMNVMRINCAHDHPGAWSAMIGHLRAACAAAGRTCPVMMDLAGPKVRTGAMQPGPRVLRWRPTRDEHGRVTRPARLWLASAADPSPPPEPLQPGDAALRLPPEVAAALVAGGVIRLRDARDRRTRVRIDEVTPRGVWASCDSTAYIEPRTVWRLEGSASFRVQDIPPLPQRLTLQPGDPLILTASPLPGHAEKRSPSGQLGRPGRIPFTLPQAFGDCTPGQSVWLDDGKIGCVIEAASADELHLRVVQAPESGAVLGPDKGINLPDTRLRLPALTEKDEHDLAFIARHADMVAYSFVREAEHVAHLQSRLRALGRPDLGLILKVETRRAFEALPAMLLQLLHSPRAGVMIARGDLAVECGYERLAEVQEEILWLCEAAHVPVIWATQVLDRLAKRGQPTRAEITDAAMSGRAECVMLNKGPHIARAVTVLDDILRRMQAHHAKKAQMMRPLSLARGFAG